MREATAPLPHTPSWYKHRDNFTLSSSSNESGCTGCEQFLTCELSTDDITVTVI